MTKAKKAVAPTKKTVKKTVVAKPKAKLAKVEAPVEEAKIRVKKDSDNLTDDQNKWWQEIKRLPIELYGLSDRAVENVATPVNINPKQLNLRVSAPAGIVAIEQALQGFFVVEPTVGVKMPKYMMTTDAMFVLIKPSEGTLQKTASGKYVFVPDEW